MYKETGIRKLFEEFQQLSVMVIGDVMVDSYLWGKVDRISPEAPIPVVALKKRENRMGGAANVALNIKSMGAQPLLFTVIGDDDKGNQFLDMTRELGIPHEGILQSKKRITTTKFRIFGNSYQMLRVDEEVDEPLAESDHIALMKAITRAIQTKKIDCIIFQDYDKGVITPALISEVTHLANDKKIPVTVDPKKRNFLDYKHVTLFKPNLKELKDGLGLSYELIDNQTVIEAVESLRKRLNCEFILTTMSEKGVLISYQEKKEVINSFIPAHLRTISDVSGAGDTVITVASMCLALHRTPNEIAYISNLAGGLVCEEVGVVPVDPAKLEAEMIQLL
jgi:rfaE bifunctional protein kinase chain/domain